MRVWRDFDVPILGSPRHFGKFSGFVLPPFSSGDAADGYGFAEVEDESFPGADDGAEKLLCNGNADAVVAAERGGADDPARLVLLHREGVARAFERSLDSDLAVLSIEIKCYRRRAAEFGEELFIEIDHAAAVDRSPEFVLEVHAVRRPAEKFFKFYIQHIFISHRAHRVLREFFPFFFRVYLCISVVHSNSFLVVASMQRAINTSTLVLRNATRIFKKFIRRSWV